MGQSLLRAQETTQLRLKCSLSIKSASAKSTPGRAPSSARGDTMAWRASSQASGKRQSGKPGKQAGPGGKQVYTGRTGAWAVTR
jgi:hypothetical protein